MLLKALVGLQRVIVALPGHTHLPFNDNMCFQNYKDILSRAIFEQNVV